MQIKTWVKFIEVVYGEIILCGGNFFEGRLRISATCFERLLDFQNTKKFCLICNVKILKNAFELWKQQLQIR